jgi:RNA polymerase sigma factor (sigma-70 family)
MEEDATKTRITELSWSKHLTGEHMDQKLLGNRASSWDELEAAYPVEQAWLTHLCARFSGSYSVAEDLAQETWIEAWRHRERITEPGECAPWLAKIAYYVCQRWKRRYWREQAHLIPSQQASTLDLTEWLADDLDIAQEFERSELTAFLDRALALLPRQSREALILRYIEEKPGAEAAELLGISEKALAVRVHRGKAALKQVLGMALAQEAAAFGMSGLDTQWWRQTQLWCPTCGQSHLEGDFVQASAELSLHCPTCKKRSGKAFMVQSGEPGFFDGIKTVKAALDHLMAWNDGYYQPGLATGRVPCPCCGRTATLLIEVPEEGSEIWQDEPGVRVLCSCAIKSTYSVRSLALSTPAGRRFWKEHARIRLRQQRRTEYEGCDVLITSYESVNGSATLDTVVKRATFEVLAVHQTSGHGFASQ